MHLSGLDGALWAANFIAEIVLVAMMLRKNMRRVFPFFAVYLIFNIIIDPTAYCIFHSGSTRAYTWAFFISNVLDYTLQLLVLAEIAINVLQPVRKSLPAGSLGLLTVMLVICLAPAIWLTPHAMRHDFGRLTSDFLTITLVLAFLRLLIFVLIAGFAQLLGIGWKNHVLQLSTGLAFYGAVVAVCQLAASRLEQMGDPRLFDTQYKILTQCQMGTYLATLAYWIWAFSQNEAPRKDFSPQMRAVLVTIAGTARSARLAVTRGTGK